MTTEEIKMIGSCREKIASILSHNARKFIVDMSGLVEKQPYWNLTIEQKKFLHGIYLKLEQQGLVPSLEEHAK